MFMPDNLTWLEPVIWGAIVVFVVDLIGNMLSFSNRFVNALVTALVFAVIFAILVQVGIVDFTASVAVDPAAPASTTTTTTTTP
jgi:hypothetical protein